jgi:NAD(P)-dependent dehydrogenase (short-subunit alcohol dehydrogenase family)
MQRKLIMTFKNRIAFVTGAGSGIGRAIAVELAADDAAVAVSDINRDTAEETVAMIAKSGGRAAAFTCDTSDAASIDRAVSDAVKALGPLDIMINNAGIIDGFLNVDEIDDALWRRVIDIDVTGVFFGCKRALREMLPRGYGRIVNTASIAGISGSGGGAAYVAAKHAVVGLTRQMGVTYAGRGINTNAVCPGPIGTNLPANSREIFGAEGPERTERGLGRNPDKLRDIVPAGRRGTAEEVASAACYLASDEAAYINGQTLVIDGGLSAK